VPVALEIEPRVFEGDSASSIMEQVKHYLAEEVIPHIPLIRLDEIYRAKVRKMSTLDLSRMLVEYMNSQEGAFERKFPIPADDDEAVVVLEHMGFLVAEP
jgi:hypothetical protein